MEVGGEWEAGNGRLGRIRGTDGSPEEDGRERGLEGSL